MNKNIGFIGCGNMGSAMMQGILDSGKCRPQEIMISCRTQATLDAKKKQFDVQITTDNRKVAEFADILFVAVKPQFYEEVLTEVKDALKNDVILISIAPGKTLQWFADLLGSDRKVIRTMPNTPSMVKEGMMGMCIGSQVTEEEVTLVRDLCEGFTQTEVIPEHLMDVVTAVSGSSPAYVFLFIEAMADAAVAGACRASRLISLQHRQYLEAQRWFWRPENIRENLRIWFVHRQEPRFRRFVCLRREACGVV